MVNSIIARGDQAIRTMQELAELTNDDDYGSVQEVVRRLQKKFQLLLDENQKL